MSSKYRLYPYSFDVEGSIGVEFPEGMTEEEVFKKANELLSNKKPDFLSMQTILRWDKHKEIWEDYAYKYSCDDWWKILKVGG